MPDLPPIVVFHDDHEECDKQLRAAQATIQSLTAVVEQAEAHVEDRDQLLYEHAGKIVQLEADNAELLTALREANTNRIKVLSQHCKALDAVKALRADRDRLSDEVARLNATIVRLSGAIREQPGDLRVALTDEQVDAARALLALVHYDDLAASWLDLLPPVLGGPFGSRP